MSRMTDLVLEQLANLADDKDRPADERRLLKAHLREITAEFARLSKIEVLAVRIARQVSAEKAYALHDELIALLDTVEATQK